MNLLLAASACDILPFRGCLFSQSRKGATVAAARSGRELANYTQSGLRRPRRVIGSAVYRVHRAEQWGGELHTSQRSERWSAT